MKQILIILFALILAGCGTKSTDGTTTNKPIDKVSKSTGVKTIYSTNEAFAALKDDGSVVTWGFPQYGGNSSQVSHLLK